MKATIPDFLAHLPVDRRGYPVPAAVFVDAEGRPHFSVNDEAKRQWLIHEDRCQICGRPLTRYRAWVGGPGSAFEEHGWYIDPALHIRCAEYALVTCPYLAAPSYTGRIDDRTFKPGLAPEILFDPTMDPQRPHHFVLVVSRGCNSRLLPGGLVQYQQPWRPHVRVEVWRHGRRVDAAKDAAAQARLRQSWASPSRVEAVP